MFVLVGQDVGAGNTLKIISEEVGVPGRGPGPGFGSQQLGTDLAVCLLPTLCPSLWVCKQVLELPPRVVLRLKPKLLQM